MKNRGKISKNCVLVFGKVKQNSDGEVRILLGNEATCWGDEAICWGDEAICWGNEANLMGK